MEDFSDRKAKTTRVKEAFAPDAGERTRSNIGERIRRGGPHFQKEHLQKFTPAEADQLGLFFACLLAELPLHKIQRDNNGKLPRNATLEYFHKQHAPRFKEWLRAKPSLQTGQSVTESFLEQWSAYLLWKLFECSFNRDCNF